MRRTMYFVILLTLAIMAAGAQQYSGLSSVVAIPGIQAGSRLALMIRGDVSDGKVFGSDIYSADSSIAAAAVHAGILQNGQIGTVTLEIMQGSPSYTGSARYGVTSLPSASYRLGFRFIGQMPGSGGFQPPPGQQPPAPLASKIFAFTDPSIIARLVEKNPGMSTAFLVTGTTNGIVKGTGTYTIDSSLATAAVHAGILSPGQKGLVRVTLLPGQNSYPGSAKNGVTSVNSGASPSSYALESIWDTSPVVEMTLDPGSVAEYPGAVAGKNLVVWIKGRKTGGSVWGSEIYTNDSTLALAAVHAGVLADGESAAITVKVLPGQDNYSSTTKNGVSTSGYGYWGLSYSLERFR